LIIALKSKQHKDIASFYCYLKHDTQKDLDDIWRCLEFYTKQKAKDLLEKYFNREVDYKIFAPEASGAKHDKVMVTNEK
jgi:hypothetical protein